VSTAAARADVCSDSLNTSQAFGIKTALAHRSASFSSHARASSIVAGITGTAIITELAKGAVGGAGAQLYGYAMEQLGLGAPNYGAKLDRLESEIRAANKRLDELQASVSELQGVTSQASFSNLVGQALPIISMIKYTQSEIGLLPTETPTGQKREARRILTYICTNLLDKQTELGDRLVGTAPTADNLITASSKAARDSVRYWTEHQSETVRRVASYYIEYEALLLQLRVEWWHAIGASNTYTVAQIDKVKTLVEKQQSLLKPDIERPTGSWERGQHYFVDVKNPGLVWWPIRVSDALPAYSPQNVASLEQLVTTNFGGSWDKMGLQPFRISDFSSLNLDSRDPQTGVYKHGWRFVIRKPGERNPDGFYGSGRWVQDAPWGRPGSIASPANDGFEWAPATFGEVHALIAGWTGSPLAYLRANSKPFFSYSLGWYDWNKTSAGNEVIWTRADGACCDYRLVDLRNGNTTGPVPYGFTGTAGLFAVRPANSRGYWY
jgi:hypothetical protein